MKKKLICLVLALVMCATFSIPTFATSKNFETLSLNQNYELTAAVNPSNTMRPLGVESAKINLSINDADYDNVTGSLSLDWNGNVYPINLHGFVTPISADGFSGKVGTLFGELIEGGEVIPVCLNTTYTKEDSIVFISLGVASENSDPLFLAFGAFSDAINAINEAYAKEKSDARNLAPLSVNEEADVMPLADNSIAFQDSNSIIAGRYTVGAVAIYAAENISQGDYSTAYSKVTSNTSGVRSYLVSSGYDSNLLNEIYPITVKTSLIGTNKNYHTSEQYHPAQGSNISSTVVPFYTPSLGFQTITLSLLMDSVTINEKRVSGAQFPTGVEWKIYARNGLDGMNTTDAISSSEKGLGGRTQFQYEGSLSKPTDMKLSTSANITYEFYYVMDSGSSYLTFQTETYSALASTTVAPK